MIIFAAASPALFFSVVNHCVCHAMGFLVDKRRFLFYGKIDLLNENGEIFVLLMI